MEGFLTKQRMLDKNHEGLVSEKQLVSEVTKGQPCPTSSDAFMHGVICRGEILIEPAMQNCTQ